MSVIDFVAGVGNFCGIIYQMAEENTRKYFDPRV